MAANENRPLRVDNPFRTGPGTDSRMLGSRILLASAFLTVLLYFVPFAGYLTYPLRLLGTFIHEGSHALAAILTGGWVQSISIQPDGSGLTKTIGGIGLIISPAGYLGAMLYGALLVSLIKRGVSGKPLLLTTGVLVGLVTLGIFLGMLFTGNLFGLFWGILLTVALGIAGWKLTPQAASWTAAFIGIQCIMNALYDLGVLFSLTTMGHGANDAANMQHMTWIPAPVWATLWIATALGMLWIVLCPSKRRAVSTLGI